MYVKLSKQAYDQLVRLAEQQRRDPRDQAAILIEEALAQHPQLAAA